MRDKSNGAINLQITGADNEVKTANMRSYLGDRRLNDLAHRRNSSIIRDNKFYFVQGSITKR